jgi:hypothetical protein
MTYSGDIEDRISLWMEEEGVAHFPDRMLEETFGHTREMRQTGSSRWRTLPTLRSMGMLAAAGAAAVVIVVVGFVFLRSLPSQPGVGASPTPASSADVRTPFLGIWVSTSDADGGTQTMTVTIAPQALVDIVVTDTIATVCDFTPSTMTAIGSVEGTMLVMPEPDYRCDDGSVPQTASGPPLAEQLRNYALILDSDSDSLSDEFGGLWRRVDAMAPIPEPVDGPTEPVDGPTGAPAIEGSMWPQTSLADVRAAQDLADAGDPAYTWQVDASLVGDAAPWGAEVLDRFLREGLGWEEFEHFDGMAYGEAGSYYTELVFFRCQPGATNPLYPDDPAGGGCAPTIDEFSYETVMLTLERPARRDRSGIWVVTEWQMSEPRDEFSLFEHLYPDFAFRQVQQVAPPTDGEAAELVETFLEARLDGEGAEQYLHLHPGEDPISNAELVPMLLYATTDGDPYERYELERTAAPEWPAGWAEFRTRLFAEDGTVVEQSYAVIRQEDGNLGLLYGYPTTGDSPTTENGQAVSIPYSFMGGRVTFEAVDQWDADRLEPGSDGGGTYGFSVFERDYEGRFELVVDPLPVEGGCEPGSIPSAAAALAQSIGSDPDLEATEPVAVSVGGIDAIQMDVVSAPGASACGEGSGAPRVITDGGDSTWAPGWLNEENGRMRLYLLDLPGAAAEVLAIAISAPASEFERVVDEATRIIDSIEFHTP